MTAGSGHALKGAAGAVILLHGRGGSVEDILSLSQEFDLPQFAWLTPEAAGRTWYPYSFLSPIQQNEPWLTAALDKVKRTVEDARRTGIPLDKIVIAGFSQGACLATEFVARNAARYGGLIAFTGGLIGPPGTEFSYAGSLAGTPAFFGSGDPDPHVPWPRVQESASVVSRLGAQVVLKRYPGLPHTVSREEIEEARRLIASIQPDPRR
ncbi:Phospholipase/Carboxylesterase [Candidatus Sulfopaludibacter sp. SbA3]|nr:Phospholipase/Carboxylesterase [Candidatus Sulfopaludibacter sp. SbA3]